MVQIRENMQKHTTSHKVMTMLLRTDFPATVTKTNALYIFVAVRKETTP